MNKKNLALMLIITSLWSLHVQPINLRQAVSLSAIKSALKNCTANLTLKNLSQHKFYKPSVYVAKRVALVGTLIWVARFINHQRNASSSFSLKYDVPDKDNNKFLRIKADGLITIQTAAQDRPSVRTEILDPDDHSPSKEYQKVPQAMQLPWWKKCWYWLVEPPHRRVNHHIITVPANTYIWVTSKNKHPYAHRFKNSISIKGVNGLIKAKAHSGDVSIVDPGAYVEVQTPDSIEVENFKAMVCADGFSHIHATPAKDNTQNVYFYNRMQPKKNLYDVDCDEIE